MIVAGLTGSIAMGKSTVAAMFGQFGTPVFDADAAVHAIYAGEGANRIGAIFPGVLVDGRVDRDRLSRIVLNDAPALARLEGLVHPAVAAMRAHFASRAKGEGRRIAVVDVPLLFETGGDAAVDCVLVVSAPAAAQRVRALAREGMSEEKLDAILARQMSDKEKCRRAHFVIDTGGSLERTRAQVAQFLRAAVGLEGRKARHA
jgi:dephospho-CoA kinase